MNPSPSLHNKAETASPDPFEEAPSGPSPEGSEFQVYSTWKLLLFAVIAGLVVFLLGSAFDWLLLRENESRRLVIEVSDALGGLIASFLVFRLLQYEMDRRLRLRERIEAIANMNHHVRNALQVISFSAFSAADQQQLQAVRDSVNRIQWALREILPKV